MFGFTFLPNLLNTEGNVWQVPGRVNFKHKPKMTISGAGSQVVKFDADTDPKIKNPEHPDPDSGLGPGGKAGYD